LWIAIPREWDLVQHASKRNKENTLLLSKGAAFAAFAGHTLVASEENEHPKKII